MVVKTRFAHDDFLTILANYRLGDYQHSQALSDGSVQTNFLLTTTLGEFIFKCYENRSVESVRFEANLVQYIHRRHFPCAAILKNKRGRSVGIYHHKSYMIFEYIDGQHVANPTPNQQHQIIHTAAALQALTKRYAPQLRQFRWNYTPDRCLNLVQQAAASLDTSTAHEKLKWFQHQLAQLRLPNSLPKGICHCDYDLSNILFKGDKLVALLDFDDANYTYLIFDLINLIDGWAWPHEQDFNPHTAQQIVRTYSQMRSLSTLEKRHLFDVHKLQILFDGIWFFERGQSTDFYERRKIEHLDSIGREKYYQLLCV